MRASVLCLCLFGASAFAPPRPRTGALTRRSTMEETDTSVEPTTVVTSPAAQASAPAGGKKAKKMKKPKKVIGESSAMPEGYKPTERVKAASASSSGTSRGVSGAKRSSPSWAGKFAGKAQSSMVPVVPRAPLLDGLHAGDGGFDPLGISKTDGDLYVQMEAEVKHGRLAMLAILGWLAVENHPLFGEFTLQAGGRAPSLLNGGLFSDNGKWVLAFFALVGVYETQATFGDARLPKQATKLGKLHYEDLGGDAAAWQYGVAGDVDFDPLSLYGKTPEARKQQRDAEILNGRLAMLAIAFAAFYEAGTGAPVTTLAAPSIILFVFGFTGYSAVTSLRA